MTITAKIVADSLSPAGIRLTTMELQFHRFILPEFNTHRMFSRNASSSRAIPIEKMIASVEASPAMPIHWGKNQPGMQARVELTQEDLEEATERCAIEHENNGDRFAELPNWWYSFTESHEGFDEYGGGSYQTEPKNIKTVLEQEWIGMAREQAKNANELSKLGLHKQIVNRLLEPFQYIKVIVTATEWDNFFKLRLHKDAQPEICTLAAHMKEAMDNSLPVTLSPGEWHLPYITTEDCLKTTTDHFVKLSVARCARVSYLNHDASVPDVAKDIALADMLLEAGHMSPFEHQATPMEEPNGFSGDELLNPYVEWEDGVTHMDKEAKFWSGNFRGWLQYRQLI